MNPFAASPAAMQSVAAQTIADRIHDIDRRAAVRTVRAERRAARRAAHASYEGAVRRLPVWTFRFVHPVP
jgi:hypothetical protein